MTAPSLSPRRAMLAQASALADHLRQTLELSPDRAAALSLALFEDSQVLKLDSLERLIDTLKAEVLSLERAAERLRFDETYKRPRGYQGPRVPAYLSTLLDAENPTASNSTQAMANLEGTLRVLDVVCALYLHRVGSGSLISSSAPRPLLLLDGEAPLAWVLLPELHGDKEAKALCERTAKHVRKFSTGVFPVRLFLSELVREGFRVLTTSLPTFNISAAQ